MFSPYVRQCFVTFGQTFSTFQLALIMSFTSSLFEKEPDLKTVTDGSIKEVTTKKPESNIPIDDDDQASWVVACLPLSLIGSMFLAAVFVGKFGRKPSSLIALHAIFLSWFFFIFATNIIYLYAGRSIQGFAVAFIISVVTIFIGEISSPRYRGTFLTCVPLSLAVGTLCGHLLGAHVELWKNRAIIAAVVALTNIFFVILTPESPSWLIDQGRYEEGRRNFRWYRGDQEEDELEKLIKADMMRVCSCADQTKSYFKDLKKAVTQPQFYKPIILMMHMQLIVVFSGFYIHAAYAEDLFKFTLKGDKVDIHSAITYINIQRVISCTVLIFLIRFSRRCLFILAVLMNVICYFVLAAYVLAKSIGFGKISELQYLGESLIHFWMLFVSLGSLPYVVGGEVFSLRYRSLCQFLSQILFGPALFFLFKTFMFLVKIIGMHGAYFLYGCIVLYALFWALIYLPETRGKTLQEVEEWFRCPNLESEKVVESGGKDLEGTPAPRHANETTMDTCARFNLCFSKGTAVTLQPTQGAHFDAKCYFKKDRCYFCKYKK